MPRVLIVEDNVDNYELVRFLLERAGYDTCWARNGREGILMAKEEKPNLILMDLSLPEIDGWTATERIKSTRRRNRYQSPRSLLILPR